MTLAGHPMPRPRAHSPCGGVGRHGSDGGHAVPGFAIPAAAVGKHRNNNCAFQNQDSETAFFVCAVPELTRGAGIQLNERVSLRLYEAAISSNRRA
jgi:hypothetical protein